MKPNIKEIFVCPLEKINKKDVPSKEKIRWCRVVFFSSGEYKLDDKKPTGKEIDRAYKLLM